MDDLPPRSAKRKQKIREPPPKRARLARKAKRVVGCPLLDLPPELRNEIYEYVAASSGDVHVLDSRRCGKLITNASLGRVSRQVRDEFMAAVCLCAPKITARVKDFDLDHVAVFFDGLSRQQLDSFTAGRPTEGPGRRVVGAERSLEIKLQVTGECPDQPESLQPWLVRLGDPTGRGSKIKLSYSHSGDGPRPARESPLHLYLQHLSERYSGVDTSTARMREETYKIRGALFGRSKSTARKRCGPRHPDRVWARVMGRGMAWCLP